MHPSYSSILRKVIKNLVKKNETSKNDLLKLSSQAFHSLAKCVAAVVVEGGEDALDVVRGFLRDAAQPTSDAHHMFALLALAEIGRHL